jgi:E3 ubiquitin-protein ligase synoviolin
VHLLVYSAFFIIVFAYYGLPLHLVRELYWTFRTFRGRVADFIRYRRATAGLNERFPDATEAQLAAGDAICIICREEMAAAAAGGLRPKRMPCGHAFPLNCLRSWLERQQSCPTCRAPVVPVHAGDGAPCFFASLHPAGICSCGPAPHSTRSQRARGNLCWRT